MQLRREFYNWERRSNSSVAFGSIVNKQQQRTGGSSLLGLKPSHPIAEPGWAKSMTPTMLERFPERSHSLLREMSSVVSLSIFFAVGRGKDDRTQHKRLFHTASRAAAPSPNT
jgi:hypothetical protein